MWDWSKGVVGWYLGTENGTEMLYAMDMNEK